MFKSLPRDPIDVSLHVILVTADGIKKIIYGLRSNSFSKDYVTLKTLKCLSPVISEVLYELINECFHQGEFPDCFVCVRVLFKIIQETIDKLSVLSIISRVLALGWWVFWRIKSYW